MKNLEQQVKMKHLPLQFIIGLLIQHIKSPIELN